MTVNEKNVTARKNFSRRPFSSFFIKTPTSLSPPALRTTSPYHKGRHVILAPLCKGSWLSVGQTEGLSVRTVIYV